jgi:hypothetical protein
LPTAAKLAPELYARSPNKTGDAKLRRGDMESMRRHGEYAMSLAQIAASEWSLVFGAALGCLLITIFMVAMQRKLSSLRADFKLLSDEVTHLKMAEVRRFMTEINAPSKNARKKKADDADLEPAETAAPPIVPAHLDIPANTSQHISDPKHWRDCAAQMRVMSDWTKDSETKATMLKLADDYDALAERCGPSASTSHH